MVKEILLNLGSFTIMFKSHHNCFINIDIRKDLEEYANHYKFNFMGMDVTKVFPFKDESIDIIVSHHLIEHLDRVEGDAMLKECLRVLKSGGVIRLGTPDLDKFIEMLPRFKLVYAKEFEVQNAADNTDAFFRLAFMGHKTIYNYETLCEKVKNAGFVEIKRVGAGQSRSNTILSETVDSFPDHSFFLEAEKPPQSPQQEKAPTITVGKPEQPPQPYQRYLRGELAEGKQDAG